MHNNLEDVQQKLRKMNEFKIILLKIHNSQYVEQSKILMFPM